MSKKSFTQRSYDQCRQAVTTLLQHGIIDDETRAVIEQAIQIKKQQKEPWDPHAKYGLIGATPGTDNRGRLGKSYL